MTRFKCPCCRHVVPATIVRDDFIHKDGVARWANYMDSENPGSPVGFHINEKIADIEKWFLEAIDANDRDSVQCMAVALVVWRLHNRRDRTPYAITQDDSETCIKVTEAEIAEIIDEANRIIEED